MKQNFLYVSESKSAYDNMAADEWFLDHVKKEEMILHLYQNANAVIIGKNQNPWAECALSVMEEEGVQLARRVSGGGAVYHDNGNINFSFICGEERVDKEACLDVICNAVNLFGIPCEKSGRNDLLAHGKKFSGTATAVRKGKMLFHGTFLISADLKKLSRYLTVDPKKIASKGITSVRSRVCNLTDFKPDLTLRQAQNGVLKALTERDGYYGEWSFTQAELAELSGYVEKHSSREWRLGASPQFDYTWKERFLWGGIELCLSAKQGVISAVKVYTDAMCETLPEALEQVLMGIPFEKKDICQALASISLEEAKELAGAFTL